MDESQASLLKVVLTDGGIGVGLTIGDILTSFPTELTGGFDAILRDGKWVSMEQLRALEGASVRWTRDAWRLAPESEIFGYGRR